MVLASAACFGTLAILVKLAYRESLDLYQVLAYRFALSAIGMIVLATLAGQSPLRLSRRRLAILLLMGVAYSAQAFSFFAALRMLSASLTELVLYTYPTFVALASWLLLRRPVRPLHLLALPLSFIGVALLIGGASFTASVGLVFAFGAPLVYTGYILTGDRVMQGTPPLAATATTLSGTALVLCIVAALAAARSGPPRQSQPGWCWLRWRSCRRCWL